MAYFKNKIKLKVGAKINLNLYVGKKREDGYHELDGIMQSVSLYDTLTIRKSDEITLECSKTHLSGENNLGYKAAKLFFKETEIDGGAHIYINKSIPEAGGLGGGSADAAAVLVGLNRLYKTNLSAKELEKTATCLGADVPFFIRGGTMRAQGIGEKLQSVYPLKRGYFVLAKAGQKPSTGEMYRRLDSKEHNTINVDASAEYIKGGDLKGLCGLLLNSFNEVWEDKSFENRLKEFTPLGVGLSGSGPTYFAVFESRFKAKQCEKALKKEKITAFTVKPIKKSVFFE